MKISIITLFPEVVKPFLRSSILGRAQKKGLVKFELGNLRDFGQGKHQVVDDRPFGGGVGMILKADVLAQALKSVKSANHHSSSTILLSASGKTYTQEKAKQLFKLDHLILICGHYEGVDQRFIEKYVSEEISIGDYVLTGGEVPALVVIDSIIRLLPGVLAKPQAIQDESFSLLSTDHSSLLEYPQYTRPENFEGRKVPQVLLSGNHQKIEQWRKDQAFKKTKKIRPDLLKGI